MVIMKVSAILMIVSAVIGKEEQCSLLNRKFALEDLNTVVDTTHKQLIGTWLSTRCEIRFGPQYLLRSYMFREDGTYKLIQHHYWDSSCSLPKFTITSTGLLRLTRNLVYNPDAAEGFIRPLNITLIPQGSDAAQELKKIIAENCPDYHWQQWKKYEEYLLHDSVFKNNAFLVKDSIINLACLGNLKWTFNELKFIKIEIRPMYSDVSEIPIAKLHRLELILGDTISEDLTGATRLSIGFQPPLLKWTKEHKILSHGKYYKIKNVCGICENLQRSDRTPPHLLKQAELPPYIQGDWISLRCEVRSMGFYLTRRFSFLSVNNFDVWTAEHKFYLDPFCAVPKFSVNTAGNFQLLEKNSVQSDATNINLNVDRVSLTIFDRKMSEEMSKSNSCNIDVWEVDIPYNIKHNYKCSDLNLIVPSIQYEIVKLDINYEGSSLLYLGSMNENIFSRVTQKRPTSYSEPLMKCIAGNYFEDNWETIVSNKIYLSSHGRNLFISASCNFYVVVLLIYLLYQT